MVLSPSEAWDTAYEATPASTEEATGGDDEIRDLKRNVRERMEVDHDFDDTGGDDTGEHTKVTLRVRTAPTQEADKGILYSKDVSAKAELFYIDEDGNEVQMTDAGTINVGAATLPAVDTQTLVKDPVDATKLMRIDVGAVGTGTTKVLTMPNENINLDTSSGSFAPLSHDHASLTLAETTAPSTSASEGAVYTKDTGGQPELFYREESDGDEVQITDSGGLSGGVTPAFTTGDQVLSPMTTAPGGWTIVTTWNDRVLRIRDVGGQATGGSASVASGTVTSGAGSSHSHTGSATHSAHVHIGSAAHADGANRSAATGTGRIFPTSADLAHGNTGNNTTSLTHNSTGSESAHTHVVTYNLSYLDIIAIQKT